MTRAVPILAASLLAGPVAAQDAVLVGTATTRERIAFPPSAILTVRIEDPASGEFIAEARYRTAGKSVPLFFRVAYRREAVGAKGRGRARVSIEVDGEVWFETASPVSVALDGKARLDVVLARKGEAVARPSLIGPTWELTELRGVAARRGLRDELPSLKFDAEGGGFSGFGGVNRLTGRYLVTGSQITVTPGGSTRMAGPPELLDQERRFVDALGRGVTFIVKADRLELRDTDDRPVARFRARRTRDSR